MINYEDHWLLMNGIENKFYISKMEEIRDL